MIVTPQRRIRELPKISNLEIGENKCQDSLDKFQSQKIAHSKILRINFIKIAPQIKVPLLKFGERNSQSQDRIRQIYPNNDPITHQNKQSPNPRNSGNLWYHEIEAKEIEKRRQQIF